MNKYSLIIENILNLKQEKAGERIFQVENNSYHQDRIQEVDVDIILKVLNKRGGNANEFAAELYCRTLLSQIIHSSFNTFYFENQISNPCRPMKYEFVETIGGCPTQCRFHLNPLVIPLLIIHGSSLNGDSYRASLPFTLQKEVLEKNLSYIFEYKKMFLNRVESNIDLMFNCEGLPDIVAKIKDQFCKFEVAI